MQHFAFDLSKKCSVQNIRKSVGKLSVQRRISKLFRLTIFDFDVSSVAANQMNMKYCLALNINDFSSVVVKSARRLCFQTLRETLNQTESLVDGEDEVAAIASSDGLSQADKI